MYSAIVLGLRFSGIFKFEISVLHSLRSSAGKQGGKLLPQNMCEAMAVSVDVFLNLLDVSPDPLDSPAMKGYRMAVPPGDLNDREIVAF